jgi:phenylalanyl-tRNA synthetase alpha chain
MTSSTGSSPLHHLEKTVLKALVAHDKLSIEELAENTGLGLDQIRRAIEWLRLKKLIHLDEVSVASLGKSGFLAIRNGLPERRLINHLKGDRNIIGEILNTGFFSQRESHSAFKHAVQNKWVEQRLDASGKKILIPTEEAEKLSTEERLLKKLLEMGNLKISELAADELSSFNSLKKRDPEYVKERKLSDKSFVTIVEDGKKALGSDSETGSQISKRKQEIQVGRQLECASAIDVEAPVRSLLPGRTHPIVNLVKEIGEIFVGLGFSEIGGPILQSSFWNFDALFTPQDHPAREMQDSFYISNLKDDKFATEDQVRKVAMSHDKGWGYKWKIEDARGIVLRTHTTPITLKYLADNKPTKARLFSIGRVFRNEKNSYKHLAEFTQVEGIVTDSAVTLKDLMGLQIEFYAKLGIKKVKFWPTFFPYTEPSLQSMIYNEKLEKWVELFGMGIFRPQVTKPLGIENPVLAWGGGLERIAMLRLGLADVRDLYNNDLGWLRSLARCQL